MGRICQKRLTEQKKQGTLSITRTNVLSRDPFPLPLPNHREEIKLARGPHYFDLKRRIELLRFELADTRETERILHDYYN